MLMIDANTWKKRDELWTDELKTEPYLNFPQFMPYNRVAFMNDQGRSSAKIWLIRLILSIVLASLRRTNHHFCS
jgi:hypothetical protein